MTGEVRHRNGGLKCATPQSEDGADAVLATLEGSSVRWLKADAPKSAERPCQSSQAVCCAAREHRGKDGPVRCVGASRPKDAPRHFFIAGVAHDRVRSMQGSRCGVVVRWSARQTTAYLFVVWRSDNLLFCCCKHAKARKLSVQGGGRVAVQGKVSPQA